MCWCASQRHNLLHYIRTLFLSTCQPASQPAARHIKSRTNEYRTSSCTFTFLHVSGVWVMECTGVRLVGGFVVFVHRTLENQLPLTQFHCHFRSPERTIHAAYTVDIDVYPQPTTHNPGHWPPRWVYAELYACFYACRTEFFKIFIITSTHMALSNSSIWVNGH